MNNFIIMLITFICSNLILADDLRAEMRCTELFEAFAITQGEVALTPDVVDLNSFGQAMSSGLLLNSEQTDLFSIYLKVFLGDPKTELNGKTLKDITDLLCQYPELVKPLFREYEISRVEKIYEVPESLKQHLQSQINISGKIRSNLFQLEANIGFWQLMFNYKQPFLPTDLINISRALTPEAKEELRKRRKEFNEKSKKKFLKYLNQVISAENRNLLADPKIDYKIKITTLYNVLKKVSKHFEKRGIDNTKIRQTMIDLVATAGFNNQATLALLKSNDGLTVIEGLRKILDEADSMSMELEEGFHFLELLQILKIKSSSLYSASKDQTKLLISLEKNILNGPYQTMPSQTVRVRSLSIQEAPFRSCLGGSDCASRTYFTKALDPNFNYFTMTDVLNHSSGHVTVVLGTAKDSAGNDHKVAFVDKLQNVPIQMILFFLEAVRLSLGEKGYLLGLPMDVGDHNGLSNMDTIRHYIAGEILPKVQSDTLTEFTPHAHGYNFENRHSRANNKIPVKIYRFENNSEDDYQILPGKQHEVKLADLNLNKEQLVAESLQLRNSKIEDDNLKYISSSFLIKGFEEMGLYTVAKYHEDLVSFLNSAETTFKVKKTAFMELLLIDIKLAENNIKSFSEEERRQISSEIAQWSKSNDSRKKLFLKTTTLLPYVKKNRIEMVEILVNVPGIDVNQKDREGNSALFIASWYNYKKIVEMLVKVQDLNINAKNNIGNTALYIASRNDYKEIILMLLKNQNLDVNAKNNTNITALITASWNGYKELVEMLLKVQGIDLNAKDSNGHTALSIASKNGHKELATILFNAGARQ